jgi:hypothetical protein
MIARMVLLEAYSPLSPEQVNKMTENERSSVDAMNIYPFNSYVPPSGMNVAWFWDIPQNLKDKYQPEILPSSKLVIGFFSAAELKLSDSDQVFKDGDIYDEVNNNRCFQYLETIPAGSWSSIAPFDTSVMSLHDTPVKNPYVTEDMINDTTMNKKAWADFVSEEVYNNINQMRLSKGMPPLNAPEKIPIGVDKHVRFIDGTKEYSFKMEFVQLADLVRPEIEGD